jgi:hypothetical protein
MDFGLRSRHGPISPIPSSRDETSQQAPRAGNRTYDVSFGGVVLRSFSTTTGRRWASQSLQFFSGPGDFTLSVIGATDLSAGVETDSPAFLDDFGLRLVAVPEPGSMSLVALGCVALLRWGRRRRPAH